MFPLSLENNNRSKRYFKRKIKYKMYDNSLFIKADLNKMFTIAKKY